MKAMFPTIRGAVGHHDQSTKPCPGLTPNMKAIFGLIGGHGLWTTEEPMKQLPITDRTPHMVDVVAPMTFYDLDGSVLSEGHGEQTNVLSPYKAMNGTSAFYAIYAGPAPVRLILTKPSAVRDVPVLNPVTTAESSSTAVTAAIDHIEGAVAGVLTAIKEARP